MSRAGRPPNPEGRRRRVEVLLSQQELAALEALVPMGMTRGFYLREICRAVIASGVSQADALAAVHAVFCKLLHGGAMEEAERADLLRRTGDTAEADRALLAALRSERAASEAIRSQVGREPTRGILHRSAAQMAFDLGRWREAEILACHGIAGDPPGDVLHELRVVVQRAQAMIARYAPAPAEPAG